VVTEIEPPARTASPYPTHMDKAIGVRRGSGPTGEVIGSFRLFLRPGNSLAYSRNPRSIQLLRLKSPADRRARRGCRDSHDGKSPMHILDTLPARPRAVFPDRRGQLFGTVDRRPQPQRNGNGSRYLAAVTRWSVFVSCFGYVDARAL